jgi:hypothetical protein
LLLRRGRFGLAGAGGDERDKEADETESFHEVIVLVATIY